MGMKAPVTTNGYHGNGVSDWADLKRRIIAALGPVGVCREFTDLGVRFASGPNSKGKAVCHAMDRADDHPSAFVNCTTGIYCSKGGTPETLNLFDFALKYGGSRFGDWLGCIKHFANLTGIAVDGRKDGRGRILEATYDYTDEHGELLYQVLRYRHPSGKKDFRQRRPDGRGGWVYDLDGVARVLYELPLLAKYPEATVYIVEGEKDADRLNLEFDRAGVSPNAVATTSAQGAHDTGRWESYSESLRGRSAVVIADADSDGRRHARGTCAYLHGIATTVRMVELPDVGAKGDVSDWLDQDHSIEELWDLVVATEPWDPEADRLEEVVADSERDATAADLVTANAGTRWLWPQWIPLGVLTLLTAEPSTGKTRLCLDLTRRIAGGLDWPDGQPIDLGDRRPVTLWIPADNQHSELADTPNLFGFPPEAIVLNTTVGNLYGGTELQEEEQLADLEARIARINPAIVIIDTITNTTDLKSQDTADAKRQYKPLQEIAKRTGAAILCVTHTNMAGKTLGRRADEKTRVTIRLECPDPEGQPNRRKLSVALSRLSVYPAALGVTMGDAGNEYDGQPPESAAPGINGNGKPKLPTAAVQQAIGYLQARLRMGAGKVGAIRRDCDERDPPISAKSLYAARDYLEIEEYESDGRVWWRLPAKQAEENGLDEPAF